MAAAQAQVNLTLTHGVWNWGKPFELPAACVPWSLWRQEKYALIWNYSRHRLHELLSLLAAAS